MINSRCLYSLPLTQARLLASGLFYLLLPLSLLFTSCLGAVQGPLLHEGIVHNKMKELFQEHFLYHQLDSELVKRQLTCLLQNLDPSKAYLLESEIHEWIEPSDELLKTLQHEWSQGQFQEIKRIEEIFAKAILRRRELESQLENQKMGETHASALLPIDREELKKQSWSPNQEELQERLIKLQLLQDEILNGLDDAVRPIILKKIKRQRSDYEENFLAKDLPTQWHAILQAYLHAFAESFDAHTVYFTPEEARLMASQVYRKITGIGVLLREEIDGYRILRVIASSPAALSGKIQANDHIIAVDGEPTLGLDINKGIHLIQGVKGTQVRVTLQRAGGDQGGATTFDVELTRDDIVMQESRYHIQEEAFGEGKIALISLYSFYQDQKDSCGEDLRREILKLKEDGKLQAVILDLRHNLGGVLSQSVEVCGLFLHPGVVVSARTPNGQFTRLRQLRDEPVWDGPLIVLTSRNSASCSEIVAGTLQDWGRALIVGDSHTFGKGSFQLFTLNPQKPDPFGVFTITQGIYYTVSGRSPQLTGILPEIVVAGSMEELEIGEVTLKYPLPNQQVEPCYEDPLDDVGYIEKQQIKRYANKRQQRTLANSHIESLKANSSLRQLQKKKKKSGADDEESEKPDPQNSFVQAQKLDENQVNECLNIAKDWVYLINTQDKRLAM